MKRTLWALLFFWGVQCMAENRITVGILTDGPAEGHEELVSLFTEEIVALTEGEFRVDFPARYQLNGNWSIPDIQAAFKQLQEAPEVDMVLAPGFSSSLVAVRSKTFAKPTFAPMTMDSGLFDLPVEESGSGIENLNYISLAIHFNDDLEAFASITPFRKLALVVDETIFQAMPELAEMGAKMARELGVEISYVLVGADNPDLVAEIPEDADAVMIAAIPRVTQSETDRAIDRLIQRKLPSYSLQGVSLVERGILSASTPDSDWNRIARRNALNMQAVLLGGEAGDQPVEFGRKHHLTINMETARKVRVYPRYDVISSARLLHEQDFSADTGWTLSAVAREALRQNLDIRASVAGMRASREDMDQARSRLRPRLDASIGVSRLDDDNIQVGTGVAESATRAQLRFSQTLYSESDSARVDIQKHLQQANQAEHLTLELDVIAEATVTFLNILKARALVDIRGSALELARHNLELARDRFRFGQVSAADIYRWESEVAADRQSLLHAVADWKQVMSSLNRLLHRPIDERFRTIPATLKDPSLLVAREELIDFIDNQHKYALMGEWMISEGKKNAPELKQIDEQIRSVERQLVSSRKSGYIPEVKLVTEVNQTLSESPRLVHSREGETDWQAGITLSLPLFQGGGRFSRISQKEYELHQLDIGKRSIEQRIETRIRQNLHAIGASWPAIDLARLAADRAGKNLDLVQESYTSGHVSIIEFLNARDASLAASRNAINAVYDFLTDLMQLQRSISQFDFFLDADDFDHIVHQIRQYILENQ